MTPSSRKRRGIAKHSVLYKAERDQLMLVRRIAAQRNAMSLLKTVDRGAVRVITYANPPFGTMTASGSTEMFNAIVAAGEAQSS